MDILPVLSISDATFSERQWEERRFGTLDLKPFNSPYCVTWKLKTASEPILLPAGGDCVRMIPFEPPSVTDYLVNLEAFLFHDATDFRNGLADESGAEIGRGGVAAGDQQVDRRAAHIRRRRRRVLRHHLVRLARPGDYCHIAHCKSALNGCDSGGTHACAHQVGHRHGWRPQADQHVYMLPHLQARSGRRHLLGNLVRCVLRAVEFVLDFELQPQTGGNTLRRFEGGAHQVGHVLLTPVNGQPNSSDGGEQRHGHQHREQQEQPEETANAVADTHAAGDSITGKRIRETGSR